MMIYTSWYTYTVPYTSPFIVTLCRSCNVCLLFHTQCIMALSHSFLLLLSLLCKHTSYNTVLKHQLLFYYYVPEFCYISFSQVQGCYTYYFFLCVYAIVLSHPINSICITTIILSIELESVDLMKGLGKQRANK